MKIWLDKKVPCPDSSWKKATNIPEIKTHICQMLSPIGKKKGVPSTNCKVSEINVNINREFYEGSLVELIEWLKEKNIKIPITFHKT